MGPTVGELLGRLEQLTDNQRTSLAWVLSVLEQEQPDRVLVLLCEQGERLIATSCLDSPDTILALRVALKRLTAMRKEH